MMNKRTYFSKLLPGDVFQPPGHPECRCLKVGWDYYMTLDNCDLHWDDDLEYFADCGNIFTDNYDMLVEVIYKEGECKIVPKEEGEVLRQEKNYTDGFRDGEAAAERKYKKEIEGFLKKAKQYYLDGVEDAHAAMKEALHKNYEELLRRGEI